MILEKQYSHLFSIFPEIVFFNGLNSEILTVVCESRLKRFLFGPIRAYRAVKVINPQCVLLPDPELHLLLAPLLSKRCAVISDVHEDYLLVLEDRKWISNLLKPLIKTLIIFQK